MGISGENQGQLRYCTLVIQTFFVEGSTTTKEEEEKMLTMPQIQGVRELYRTRLKAEVAGYTCLHNTVQRYVKRMLREQRAVRAHYGFSVRFCNPESGHEKGNVEAKVGYIRRDLFVPESAFDDIKDYSRSLLATHAAKAQEGHYKKLVSIQKLFEEGRKALLPFPQSSFDAVLMNNPGAWKNSGIRELVPHFLKALMDRQERAALHATFKAIP